MSDALRPEVSGFLGRFFAAPNQLKQDSKPEIRTWVERLAGGEMLPTVLPCWRAGKVVDWYGLAFNDRQLSSLGESLTAFVGPTYTTFRGQIAHLDHSDPIDRAVNDLTAGRAYKFRGADPAEIWKALERMLKVWQRRGPRERATPAPVGRVLRDFYMALHAADADSAEERLTHLRERYHLDGVNLLYLRVQLLAAFRRWADLLALPELPDLLRLRRPAAVTEALLQAVYHSHLARFEDPPDPQGAVAAFRAGILGGFGFLFASRAGMRSPEAAKAFMLLAVAKGPPDLVLRDDLLTREDLGSDDRAYLRLLGALAGPAAAPALGGDPLISAGVAVAESDFDRAFTLARGAPASPARARLLCECAFELGTLDARAAAIAAVRELGDAERTAFLARRVHRQLWDTLQEAASPQAAAGAAPESLPTDWCSWLEHLDRSEGRAGSREIARRGATEWAVDAFVQSPGALERLTEQLQGKRSQAAEVALRDSLPHLVSFFGNDPAWPNPAAKEIYRALLELLVFSTDGGRADLIVFNGLLEAALALGANAAEYRELASFAHELWGRFAAPATLDWAADALALLVAGPCPDVDARRSFLQAILDRAAGFGRSLAADQRDLLRLVAADLGAGEVAASYFPVGAEATGEDADPIHALSGMAVAVYTLTERPAEQFRRVVEARAPGVTVTLLHDRDASKRLQQHARQADLFVLVTASATHAASDCVRATRPAEKPLLFPTGKGAASMLAAIRGHFERRG